MELNQKEIEFLDNFFEMIKRYDSSNKVGMLNTFRRANTEKEIFDYFIEEGKKNGFLVKTQDEDNNFPFKMAWYDMVRGKLSQKRIMTDIELLLDWHLSYSRGYDSIMTDFNKLLLTSPHIPLRVYICLVDNFRKLDDMKTYFNEAVQSCKAVDSGNSFICLIGENYTSGKFLIHKVVKK